MGEKVKITHNQKVIVTKDNIIENCYRIDNDDVVVLIPTKNNIINYFLCDGVKRTQYVLIASNSLSDSISDLELMLCGNRFTYLGSLTENELLNNKIHQFLLNVEIDESIEKLERNKDIFIFEILTQ